MQVASNKRPAVEHQAQGNGGFDFARQRLRKFRQRAGCAKEHVQIVPFRVRPPIERRQPIHVRAGKRLELRLSLGKALRRLADKTPNRFP